MLNAEQRKTILELSQSLPFNRKLGASGVDVQINIKTISWYTTKAIYVGKVVSPVESGFVGRKVVGSLSPWFEQNRTVIESQLKGLTERDVAYLLTPWNIENPTTAHELTAQYQVG